MWSEAVFLSASVSLLAPRPGWAVARVQVKILTGVFDPPIMLAVPWPGLASVGSVAIAAVVLAALAAIRSSKRPAVAILRVVSSGIRPPAIGRVGP